MLSVGGVLSTVNVALGPAAAAWLLALSVAVPAVIEMPSVPLPVMLDSVTVRVVRPEPLTATVPVAPPLALSVTSVSASVTASAPEYVIVYATGPLCVAVTDGGPMLAVGAVLSTVNVALGPAA